MTSRTISLAVVGVVASILPAQDNGRVSARVTLGGVDYQLRQVGRASPGATDHLLQLWPLSVDLFTTPPTATLAMPFDVPTDLLLIDNNTVLVSGRSRGNSAGHLCRVAVTAALEPQLILVDQVSLGAGVTYSHLVYNDVDGTLYGLRYEDPIVDAGLWSPAASLPTMSPTTSLAAVITATSIITVGEMAPATINGVGTPGVVLASSYPDSLAEPALWLRQGNSGWTVSSFIPANGLATINTCAVEYPGFQGSEAPVVFRGRAGLAQLEEVATSAIVGSAVVAQDWQPTPFVLSQPLVVGQAYRPLGMGATGAEFWPTFRAGANTLVDGHKIGLGEFAQRDFIPGNAEFAVWCRVLHEPGVPSMPGQTFSFLWAKLGEPTPENLVTLPSGDVVIADPTATFGPSPFDAEMVEEQNLLHVPFSMVGTEAFEGQALIFQFIYFLPNGSIMISDVFGGRIRPAGAAAAAGITPVPPHGGVGWPTCQAWLRQNACPHWQAAWIRIIAVTALLCPP